MGNIWYDKLQSRKLNRFWWKEPDNNVHETVFGLYDLLRNEQRHHSRQNLHHARLYGNLEMMALDPDNYARVANYEDHITYNVTESAVDTLLAEGVASKPKPFFMTDGGSWKLQRQALGLNRFVQGEFRRAGVYKRELPLAILDSLVFGTGALKLMKKFGKPHAERTFIDGLVVDDVEAIYGKPRQMYEHKWANRDVLKELYADTPAKQAMVAEAPEARSDSSALRTIADQVHVVEAWHLPSSPEADDGRHVICVETGTLVDEKWKNEDFPFVFLRYKERAQGFWGKGVGEILTGQQIAINELIWKIHLSLKLAGPKIFVRPGSELNTAHLDNEIWGIIECLEPPHIAVFDSVPPDLFRQLNAEVQNAYSLVGVNMMQARSELPAGMDGASGRALRIYTDTKSKRFIHFIENIENAVIDLAYKWVEMTADCAQDDKEYGVMCQADNQSAEFVKWSEVNLDRERYFIDVFPTNFLSGSPSDQLAKVEELTKAFPQIQQHALSLLDMPDLRAATDLVTSSTELTKQIIEKMMDGGDYISPEPFMNLPEASRLAQNYVLKGKMEGVPDANLEKIRQFIVAIQDMSRPPEPPTGMPGARTPTTPGVQPALPGQPQPVPGPVTPPAPPTGIQ